MAPTTKQPHTAVPKDGNAEVDSSDECDVTDEDVEDDPTVIKIIEHAERHPTQDRGVIYLGRLPHGFYEDQLRAYFSQFGNVTRLRISRNRTTGRSKHYGFVEFDSASVAQIVAETMDNYLLMGHILTCKVIPKEKVHPDLWLGANKKFKVIPKDQVVRKEHNKPRVAKSMRRAEKRLIQREKERKRKLEEVGIEYDFDAVSYKKKHKTTV